MSPVLDTNQHTAAHSKIVGRRRSFTHPDIEALSVRICSLLENPSFGSEMRGWLHARHAELAWAQIVLRAANYTETLPETDLRPETRRDAGILAKGEQAQPKELCAAGLVHFVDESVGMAEILATLMRMDDAEWIGAAR